MQFTPSQDKKHTQGTDRYDRTHMCSVLLGIAFQMKIAVFVL